MARFRGTPPGIWAMDRRASCPCNVVAGIGTPSTGTRVLAATIPGRCAAPPAAAMITLRPRASAVVAYSNIQSGVRWAETTRVSYRTSRSSSRAQVCCMYSKSDLPMITPMTGAGLGWVMMRVEVTEKGIHEAAHWAEGVR
jgi:hypothetical protein